MPTKPQGNDKAEGADQKWKVRIEGTLTLIREGDSDSSETEHRDTVAHQSGDEEQRSPDVSRVRMLAKNVLGWLIANATFINALFAAAIFFATCQYTVYSGRQWGAMQEANQTTRESLVSVQRAFVTFRGVEAVARMVDPVTNKATDVELATVWENSGTTPTKYMRINVNCVPRPDPLPEHFDFADVGKPEDRPVVIGPKATMLTSPCKIPIQTFGAIRQGQTHLYFWGWARYHDIFTNTPQHVTEFCVEITDIKVSSASDLADPSINISATPAMCAKHNCTDDECDSQENKK